MLDREEDGLLASVSERQQLQERARRRNRKRSTRARGGTTNARRGGEGPVAAEEKKGKERREKVEVCCAAVGTDCRASEPRFPSRFIVPAAPAASLFLYLSRSIAHRPPGSLSFSVSFCRLLHTPPTCCSSVRHRGPLSDSSPLFVVREEGNHTEDERFPSSLGILSIVFIVCRFSPPPRPSPPAPPSLPLDPRSRRYRCIRIHTPRVYIRTHTHTYTQITPARTLFPRRTAPFFVPDRDSSPISFRSPVIN